MFKLNRIEGNASNFKGLERNCLPVPSFLHFLQDTLCQLKNGPSLLGAICRPKRGQCPVKSFSSLPHGRLKYRQFSQAAFALELFHAAVLSSNLWEVFGVAPKRPDMLRFEIAS
ncbi:hypothetical protein ACVMB2_000123 [Sinorhizobium meliloti]